LTQLYALRARAERSTKARLIASPASCAGGYPKAARCGSTSANNGEQQRDSFFLYLKSVSQVSAAAGSGLARRRRRYPEFKRIWLEQHASKTQSRPSAGSKAIGELLSRRPAINDECRLSDRTGGKQGRLCRAVHERPSPGIVATRTKRTLDTFAGYLAALAKALEVEYERL